ncbi:response regulator transcription factor [Gammaproteobacteria bacterium]|nr:response regulator transcription factor [Gammaproteobacteria bacterium]
MRVLLIEDHRDVAGVIFDYFEVKGGYELDYAADGKHGLVLASDHHYDVILLDLMLPRMDGLTLCRQLRAAGNNTPVLMLTAMGSRGDTLDGFDSGADDYLVKPFDLDILNARVQALLRRSRAALTQNELCFEDLRLTLSSRVLHRGSSRYTLNRSHAIILRELLQVAPAACTREALCRAVWGDDTPDTDLLRSHIYQMRQFVDKPFQWHYITTVPKQGYRLRGENEA